MEQEAYSLWQMGRSGGRFSSMTPHACPSSSMQLGMLPVGLQAVQAVATVGIWWELHQSNKIASAQFEERRLVWLNDMIDLWVSEHGNQSGISLDATKHLCEEADRLLDKLSSNDLMDVPQVLALKCSRLCTYIDEVNDMWCKILNSLVKKSRSDESWVIEPVPSKDFVEAVIEGEFEESKAGGNLLAGGAGAAMYLIPGFGQILGGLTVGWNIGSWLAKRDQRKAAERMQRNPEIARLVVSSAQLLSIYEATKTFLAKQPNLEHHHLYLKPKTETASVLLLGPEENPAIWKRMIPGLGRPKLVSLPPLEEAA